MIAATGVAVAQAGVITPDNLGDWALHGTDSSGAACNTSSCGVASFVNGPGTPPEGTGSVNLNTPASGSAQIGTSELNGISVLDLTALSYSTYYTANNGQQIPYISLDVSTGTSGNDRWFFEPTYQNVASGGANCTTNQAATQANTWQSWDALNGCWWDNAGIATAGNSAAHPMLTLAQLAAATGGATIIGTAGDFNNGLRIRFGFASGPTFDGNVDNVTIGVSGTSTNYDFEAAQTPEPGTLVLMGGVLLAIVAMYRRRTA